MHIMRATLAAVLLALAPPLLAADASIRVTSPAVDGTDVAGNVNLHYTITNTGTVDLPGVGAVVEVPPNWTFTSARGGDCLGFSGSARCKLPALPAGQSLDFDVALRPPAGPGRYLRTTAFSANELPSTVFRLTDVTLYAQFVVTTTADAGPGSLRQAIADSNRDCAGGSVRSVPCRISFAIAEPLPARGWYTIEPLSPLPPLDAFDIVVDGTYLNTTPIELRGTHVFGDGLVLRGTFDTLRGLWIDGFFANGVVVDQPISAAPYLIDHNVIGSDPSGAPVPNGLRGIAIAQGWGTIRDNTISGNARSGIFVAGLNGHTYILDNRIANNGASGIYIGPSPLHTGVIDQVDVQGNTISGNHDFPVGTDSTVRRVAVRDNVMFGNGAPLDIGMDAPGLQPMVFDQPAPTIASAVYDAASGDTVVTIDVHPVRRNFDTWTLYIFANHALDRAGRAEAETFLGSVSTNNAPTVVFRRHGDLRGQILTALTVRSTPFEFDTQEASTELSDGVVVK